MTKKVQELQDENAAIEFEKNKLEEGTGKMRRMLSYPSAEFLHANLQGKPHHCT